MSKFDVFLSHNSVDKPWVIKLKDDLKCYGLSIWLDQDEIRPGDLFAKALEQGLANSRAMALVISPEAMASGWVEEEYYRTLSLTKNKAAPIQLIPVLLRVAEVPPFIQSRDWVDFRDEIAYAEKVWELVWGITGQKPPQVLNLPPPIVSPLLKPNEDRLVQPELTEEKERPMSQESQTGGVTSAAGKVGVTGKIVTGIDIEGTTSDSVLKTALETMQRLRTGSVSGYHGVEATEIVTGFRYFNPQVPDKKSFLTELMTLRQDLANLIADPNSPTEVKAALEALDEAATETQKEQPLARKIVNRLRETVEFISDAGRALEAAGKAGPLILQALAIASGLYQAAQTLF
ncbi:MAG: hypothetical protein BroJett011_18560 [Chloroflexota bacterium]|nr:MAG: hypothetical protein BroJett011_18560 [Chloroflexota bacterium]